MKYLIFRENGLLIQDEPFFSKIVNAFQAKLPLVYFNTGKVVFQGSEVLEDETKIFVFVE